MNGGPNPAERTRFIRDRLPAGGLFAGHEWRISPRPFILEASILKELESLGRILLQFYRTLSLLYRQSAEGRQPGWVAEWLDQGKPEAIIRLQRDRAFRNEIPRVIRPDVLLTESGFVISELDSVPGGMGLTAWLNESYAALGCEVVGGPRAMVEGFAGMFPDCPQVHIVVSEEAGTYRPEMQWLCSRLNEGGERFQVRDADFVNFGDGDGVYRFFEMFDLPNLPNTSDLFAGAREKRLRLTPPPRAFLEEKLAFALLWNRNLAEYWRQHLGTDFLKRLKAIIPYTWVIDPTPLPPQGAIPELGLTSWPQLKTLSQRERNLILKISGFSEKAWGARGVHLGSDLSQEDWSRAVDEAIDGFGEHPHILQRYHKPVSVRAEWHDFAAGETRALPGRVRLCPYYFVHGEGDAARAMLSGILATICPADKKIIHGMRDAILAPVSSAG